MLAPDLAFLGNHLPELRERPQWVGWRTAERDGKPTKLPINPNTGRMASSDDAMTWGTYAEAVAAYERYDLAGIGFVFAATDPYCGIDLDDCRDPETGAIKPWAQEIVERHSSYTEVSPSETGLKIYTRGAKPEGAGCRSAVRSNGVIDGEVECYDRLRYFALTGHHLEGTPTTIEAAREAIAWVCDTYLGKSAKPKPATTAVSTAGTPTPDDVLRVAFASRNGEEVRSLYAGDWSGRYGSQSEADLALCSHLAFYAGNNPGLVDSIFRGSGLYREKWDEGRNGSTYGGDTIAKALDGRTDFYEWKPQRNGRQWSSIEEAVLTVHRLIKQDVGCDITRQATIERDHAGEPAVVTVAYQRADGQADEVRIFTREGSGPMARWTVATKKTRRKKVRVNLERGGDPSLALTDMGNADLFRRQHGADFRYLYHSKRWLTFTGTHWSLDDPGAVERAAKKTIESIPKQDYGKDVPEKEIDDWAMASRAARRLPDMLTLARCELTATPDDLDRHDALLNTPGGTIDLNTGEVRQHDRQDFLTKITPVDCPPSNAAECPLWESTLDGIFAGDQELISFVQRAVGYSITGHTTEHALFFCYGNGANGKSLFLNTLQEALGPYYSMKAPPDLLMVKSHDTHPTERADLCGRRMVLCIEANDGRRLDEGLVKEMTGGDRIRARAMRQDFFEFRATHKIWLAANHKPQIRGTDNGIWRRIKLIPFEVTFSDEQQDKQLPHKLKAELPGILRWAVEGALAWRRQGLNEPERVRMATAEYREQEDVLGAFLASCCEVDDHAETAATALFEAYKEFTGDQRVTQTKFGRAVRERGFDNMKATSGASKNRKVWKGLRLLETGDHTGRQ